MNNEHLKWGLRPPAQAPPHRGFCPGGRARWLGEIAGCGIKTPNSLLRTPNSKGFTIIEIILVMMIIAILAAVAIPKFDFGTSSKASVDGAAYMVASDIRYAQECAMATRASKTITFSAGGNSYSFNPTNNLDPTGRLPYGVTTTALTLTFNSLGEPTSIPAISPYYVDLTVSGGGLTKTTRIWCFTGKVTIL
jgi:prepilin-type N-terminal cleavage/methylation domain-containing protein